MCVPNCLRIFLRKNTTKKSNKLVHGRIWAIYYIKALKKNNEEFVGFYLIKK